jgi:hypothetical protein
MGDHSAGSEPAWYRAGVWTINNRRKLIAGAIVALPLLSRYVPDFPSDAIMTVLRGFLGA